MIIRSFGDFLDSCDDDDLERFGILQHKRTIYIFVDPNEYKHKIVKKGKCVIINECVYLGKKGNLVTIKIDNSTINRTAVYFGVVGFEVPSDVRTAIFNIDVGTNKETQTIHDTHDNDYNIDNTISREKSIISASMLRVDNEDGCIDEIVSSNETYVLPPTFYTEYHMVNNVGDFGNFMLDFVDNKYDYRSLTDRTTKYQFMDINLWDTMKAEINHCLGDLECGNNDAFTVSDTLSTAFNSNLTDGAIFIYDSDGNGFGKDGINVKGGRVPYGKYYSKHYLARNLENSLSLFTQSCHLLEGQYGHIRVMCNPSEIGAKTKITFKDYVKPPIKPIKTEGMATTSAIDNGSVANRCVDELIKLTLDNGRYSTFPLG